MLKIKRACFPGLFLAVLDFLAFGPAAGAEEFVYLYAAGDKYRILSIVNEDVFINRRLSHRAEILNRVSVEIEDTANGSGRHRAQFQTAEKAAGTGTGGRSFQWSREYDSEFDRDRLGYITIDQKYYMPVVRNVPVFPGRDLKIGDTWTAGGYEVHDFRDSFGIEAPYRIPFTANYTFLGERIWKEKQYPAFTVSYHIFAEPAAAEGPVWPTRIMGASDQLIFWDAGLGQPRSYEESFRIIFELSNGMTVEYRGRAGAEIVESEVMDKGRILKEIEDEIKRLGIQDASVRAVDEGIAISLENIQFQPDSAVLTTSERNKIDKIAEIITGYADRDILIGGHTALAGSAAGRLQLSRERAAAVADYLIGKGIRTPDRIVVRGYGAGKPLADNGTEAGRRRNRRVEITILEN
ncbi:MAG: OmpA family protein [Treponema sp.]|jgi:outer membrane protein OmpA-like peptidoglycan-associated protein|nr:OmpA family protein [Treponema sp.]